MMQGTTPTEHPSLCLGFETAALYWRAVRTGDLPMPTSTGFTAVPDSCIASARGITHIDLSPIAALPALLDASDPRLHVMVGTQARKWSSQKIRTHVMLAPLPPGSLYRVSPEIFVASPELTLLQLGRSERLLPCIELACEWSGSYALDLGEIGCHYDRVPVTDLARLNGLLAHRPAIRGSSAMLKVAKYVGEGLASPRETECFLILVLPTRLGGFALPAPLINQQIPLDSRPFGKLSRQRFYVVDFLWPDARLVVEYDGLEDHEMSPQQIAADKERRSVLAALGYTVIVITKRDLESLSALERKVRQIAFVLGAKEGQAWDEEEAAETHTARKALFAWLFDCRHDHLPFGFGLH